MSKWIFAPILFLMILGGASPLFGEGKDWLIRDGETVQEYANRHDLRSTIFLPLSNTVFVECVLIPAGTFTQGYTPQPPVKTASNRQSPKTQAWTSDVSGCFILAGLLLLGGLYCFRKKNVRHVGVGLILIALLMTGGGVMLLNVPPPPNAPNTADAPAVKWPNLEEGEGPPTDPENFRRKNALPARKVTISRPFYMGRYEITEIQYCQVMGMASTVAGVPYGPGMPEDQVSWKDANEFCKKASKMTGASVKLPTEAQWEYACRAGTKTHYSFGPTNEYVFQYANAKCYYTESLGSPIGVGKLKPNAWGLYDMNGNMLEWCRDWYAPDYYQHAPAVDPPGPERPDDAGKTEFHKEHPYTPWPPHVLRGGGYRMGLWPSWGRNCDVYNGWDNGFRIVVEMPEKPPTPDDMDTLHPNVFSLMISFFPGEADYK